MTFETKKIIDFCVPIFCHQFYHLDNDVVATVVELENVNSYFENFQQVGKYGVLLSTEIDPCSKKEDNFFLHPIAIFTTSENNSLVLSGAYNLFQILDI